MPKDLSLCNGISRVQAVCVHVIPHRHPSTMHNSTIQYTMQCLWIYFVCLYLQSADVCIHIYASHAPASIVLCPIPLYSPVLTDMFAYVYFQGTGSMYSSHAPPSYHRSYTPTSSRSGRSLHSHSNEGSCKYNGESKTMPVNL